MNQNQQGAILIQWEGPQAGQTTLETAVVRDSVRFIEGLQQDGLIATHRVFVSLTNPGGVIVLEGSVNGLVALNQDENYQLWVLTLQAVLNRVRIDQTLGGTSGQIQEALAQQQQAQQQVASSSAAQQARQQQQQFQPQTYQQQQPQNQQGNQQQQPQNQGQQGQQGQQGRQQTRPFQMS